MQERMRAARCDRGIRVPILRPSRGPRVQRGAGSGTQGTGRCSTEPSTSSLNRQETDVAPSAAPQRVSQTSLWGGSHGAEWLRLLEEGLDETVVQEIILWTMLRIIDDKERLDKLLSCPSSLVQRCLTEPAVWQALCTRHWPALSRDVASWCAPAANAGVL